MAVENTTSKVEVLGNGSATVFSFSPLRLFEPRAADGGTHDLEVTRVNADLTEEILTEGTGTNNYSVSVASYPGTGSITFPASGAARLPTGAKLVIKRKVRLKQYENLNNRGGYFADTQEEMHDRHRMVDLQQQEEIDRAIKVPIGDPTDPDVLIADLKADAAAAQVAASTAETAADTAVAAAANLPNAPTGGANNFPRINGTADGWVYLNAAALLAAIGAEDAALNHAYLDQVQAFTRAQRYSIQTLTDGANIDWNLDTQPLARVTLAGNRTMNAPTNQRDGGTYIVVVNQDGTGNRTLAWNAAFDFGTEGTPVLPTGANKVAIFTFLSNGTSMRCIGRWNN